MVLHIDMISDVICPWCYIGKRRLEKAVAAVEGQHAVQGALASVSTQSHDAEGRDQSSEYRTKKFGSWERSQELDARVIAVGKAEGIDFAFDRIERTPNTLDAHRLIWLADKEGVQDAVVEALFRAYFTEGRDISNRQTLIDVVAEAGLDRNQGRRRFERRRRPGGDEGGRGTVSAVSSRGGAVLHRQRQDHAVRCAAA